jgi:hypothetical protein
VVEAHQREEVRHNEGGKKERQKRREVVVHWAPVRGTARAVPQYR